MDQPQLVGDIYENWERLAAGKPTVIFASSQAHARHLCDEFNAHGWRFHYVDCNYPDEERQGIFDEVRNGKAVGIVNVGIVSVGIDIPNLECVVLARPTRLVSVYLQCVGRVTRLWGGKHYGIVIDHAGIIEKIGLPTDVFEWSLDGRETVEERATKKKEERKEPKQITCTKCHYVYQSRRSCPACGFEVIPKGEEIPTHKAQLQEVKKVSSVEKEDWYQQMLGWCRRHGKKDGLAFYAYQEKFGVEPKWKKVAKEPSVDVVNWFRHRAIKRSKAA
jgi:superfamily II DNA or RNA helicase